MPAYFVTWDKDDWPYEKLLPIVEKFKKYGHVENRWMSLMHLILQAVFGTLKVQVRPYLIKYHKLLSVFGHQEQGHQKYNIQNKYLLILI